MEKVRVHFNDSVIVQSLKDVGKRMNTHTFSYKPFRFQFFPKSFVLVSNHVGYSVTESEVIVQFYKLLTRIFDKEIQPQYVMLTSKV